MNTLNKIGLVFFLIGIACCKDKHIDILKKTEPVLPPITMEGKNTFGCMVNGQLYLPNEYGDQARCDYYPWSSSHEFYGSLAIVSIKNKFSGDKSASINLTLRNRVFNIGKKLLYSTSNLDNILRFRKETSIYYGDYAVNDTNNFILISRLDTTNRIISGTFQFKIIHEHNNLDTIRVTDGRFDFRF